MNRKSICSGLGCAAILISNLAFAAPAQIIIIRHAEKPASGNQLDQQGCERAFLLPGFFQLSPVVNQYGKPAAVFASQPDHAGSSVRPVQTIAPTAQALGLTVQDPATRLDYQTIVQAIMNNPSYNGQTVLLAWEHDAIPGLAQAFGATLDPSTQTWPGVVFDEAWVLDFASSQSGAPSLQIIPENVLPGDNPQGGSAWQNPPSEVSQSSIPQTVVNECTSNGVLNSIAKSLAVPPISLGKHAKAKDQ